ncbi:NAD-dependent epimerase/dehydratase family protein [Acholeplasma laidlawii]|uniref:NAD-dependent epimerase/dehydratase family protein n=1 Tax=Acholeplasma laidlawii TaxID=2148 RepID=UPI003F8E54F1
MKSILITGKNSYVGSNVENWLQQYPDKYKVDTLDMLDQNWKDFDFSKYDVVFHVAGIAHSTPKKSQESLYYKVNTDLVIETATIAKQAGVKQFIFMSSMIVYNKKEKRITKDTLPNPDNFYGNSKLQAEIGLQKLDSQDYKIVIIRPPMIYGPHSKGNFPKLMSFARKSFIFPNFKNKRSMLYIDNLSNSIKYLIDEEAQGTYFPQNSDYMSTSQIVRDTAKFIGKKMWFTRIFNPIIYLTRGFVSVVNKMFSDFYYDKEISESITHSNAISFRESIEFILNNEEN